MELLAFWLQAQTLSAHCNSKMSPKEAFWKFQEALLTEMCLRARPIKVINNIKQTN